MKTVGNKKGEKLSLFSLILIHILTCFLVGERSHGSMAGRDWTEG